LGRIEVISHDKDLERRFFGIDYVSEFQKHWAMFNKWFKNETGKDKDREAIKRLKINPRVDKALRKLTHRTLDPVIAKNLPQSIKDYYTYTNESLASSFVKACWHDSIIKGKLNLFNPRIVKHVRGTATIHVTVGQYRSIHSINQKILAQNMHYEELAFFASSIDMLVYDLKNGAAFTDENELKELVRKAQKTVKGEAVKATEKK